MNDTALAVAIHHQLPGRLRLAVTGLKRAPALAAQLDALIRRIPGVSSVTANPLTGRVLVSFDSRSVASGTIIRQVAASVSRYSWQTAETAAASQPDEPPVRLPEPGPLLYTVATGGLLAGTIAKRLLVGRSPLAASSHIFNAAALVTLLSGYPILRNGLRELAHRRRVNSDLMLFMASLTLLAMRESITGLAVLWVVHLNNLFRRYLEQRSLHTIQAMVAAKHPLAIREEDGRRRRVAIGALSPGDVVIVKAGGFVPVDGEIVSGQGEVDQAAVCGKCCSQTKTAGDAIFAGSRVTSGEISVKTLRAGDKTTIAHIHQLTRQAAELRPKFKTRDFPGKVLTGTALAAALLFLLTRDGPRSLAVLLAGCPEAIELSRHAALGAGLGKAARRGIYVRDPEALEAAGTVDTIIFDKTGTLAEGAGEQENPKPRAAVALTRLKAAGVERVFLVTGDGPSAARAVAERLGIDEWQGGMSPEDKLRLVDNLQLQGHRVMMVGDGLNDAPALAAAASSVAMGRGGACVAVQESQAVIDDDDPAKVAELVAIGQECRQTIRRNHTFSIGFGALGVGLAAARLISPVTAALFLNLSTLGVLFSSYRMLSRRRRREPALDLQRFSSVQPTTEFCKTAPVPQEATRPLPRATVHWHAMAAEAVCDRQQTTCRLGIDDAEARARQAKAGLNLLATAPKPSFWQLFFAQFKDFMVRVLLGAVGLSCVLGRVKDAALTLAIVLANAVLGVVQERKAEKAIEALQQITAPEAKVIRGGKILKIKAESLVPGDIIMLEAGDRVPADARLISASHFATEEASLTGETLPARKDSAVICDAGAALGDQANMVFMGTSVTAGRATAVVVATGMATEMGRIASLISEQQETLTPLQVRLEELARFLVWGCLAISAAIFGIGIMRGERALYMLQTAASLAVAAIPEGLTAIVIIALAMGVQRMSKRNIIIRKLSSIETLGCATVICSDKTGTLTKNEMTVREIYTPGSFWKVTGEGYQPKGEILGGGRAQDPQRDAALHQTLLTGVLCNNARLVPPGPRWKKLLHVGQHDSDGWRVEGDPTEGAILVAAAKGGLKPQELAATFCRVSERPFEAERRMMSVLYAQHGDAYLYCKGAPDSVLQSCTHYLKDGEVLPLTETMRQEIYQANERMTSHALRVLACAYRHVGHGGDKNTDEQELVFCGLMGMIDPPRAEVPAAVAKCHRAGVKVIMITGDHPNTARAVAADIGLEAEGGRVLTGREVDAMTDEELADLADKVVVYARTSPHHKLRIVKALKQRGYIVAMTGDGVNDAPAVKAADIGIAMGITGTDVTKEAASMTLGDDNFATIVKAIEEGRSIYANIRKAIRYLIATNIGEVVLMLAALLLGLPLPLLPLQLLWINMLGDGLPAIALVNDPPAKNIMHQPPRGADDSIFSGNLGVKVISRGLTIGLVGLWLFAATLRSTGNLVLARTLVVAQVVISQFIHIFDLRFERRSGTVGLFSNKWLVGAVALSLAMAVAIIQLPAFHAMFGTVSLSFVHWLLAIGAGVATSLLDIGIRRLWGTLPQGTAGKTPIAVTV